MFLDESFHSFPKISDLLESYQTLSCPNSGDRIQMVNNHPRRCTRDGSVKCAYGYLQNL